VDSHFLGRVRYAILTRAARATTFSSFGAHTETTVNAIADFLSITLSRNPCNVTATNNGFYVQFRDGAHAPRLRVFTITLVCSTCIGATTMRSLPPHLVAHVHLLLKTFRPGTLSLVYCACRARIYLLRWSVKGLRANALPHHALVFSYVDTRLGRIRRFKFVH
jgi:hypothetical protein